MLTFRLFSTRRRLKFNHLLLFGLGCWAVYHISQSYRLHGDKNIQIEDRVASKTDGYDSDAARTLEDTVPNVFTQILQPNPPSGFYLFSRLYVHLGTIYAIVPTQREKDSYPELKFIISQPIRMGPESDGDKADPTDLEMVVLTRSEAEPIIGQLENAIPVDGLSMIYYDVNQFISHYYHWWGEIVLGSIKACSAATLGYNIVKEPSRFIMPNVEGQSWRDGAGVDGPLMRAAFPSASIETMDYWEDLQKVKQAFVFEQAMIVDRLAAHHDPLSGSWGKMIGSIMNTPVPRLFWEPVRRRVVRHMVGSLPGETKASSQPGKKLENLFDYPLYHTIEQNLATPSLPLVVYISRQAAGFRRLRPEDHEGLINALEALAREGYCEFKTVKMEALTFQNQIELVAKSTILIGIHGNGLTHQLWMPSSSRSTVIEIFYPQMYLHDYEMLALNVGHKHYAVWNDTFITYQPGETSQLPANGPELHSTSIPVYGETVAKIVRERLNA